MFIELCMKGNSLPTLKGNNSCKTHNFRIKVINVKWSIGSLAILLLYYCKTTELTVMFFIYIIYYHVINYVCLKIDKNMQINRL